MSRSPQGSPYSGNGAPPVGHFAFSRPTMPTSQQAKGKQTLSLPQYNRPNGIPRIPMAMNQSNIVAMPDMDGQQISGSQVSIHSGINRALGTGYGCRHILAVQFTDEPHLDQWGKCLMKRGMEILFPG